MSLTADALRQLDRQKSRHSAPAADLIRSFVTEQQTLHRRTDGQIASSPPARPPLWEADDELPDTFQVRVQNQQPWKGPGRTSRRQHEHVTEQRQTDQNHKRSRPASTDSSVLEQAALQNRAGESQDEDGIESVQEPEKIDRRRTINYQKRSRYKMLDPGAGAARDRSPALQPEKRKTTPQKKQTKAEIKKRKSVSNALIDGFSPENIARRRITLKPSKSTGLYKETRIAPRPGLPDLSFSDMDFLRSRKHRPTFDLDVQDPADSRGRLRENNDEVIRFETTRWQRAQQHPGAEDVQPRADSTSLQSPSVHERSTSYASAQYRRGTLAETDDGRSEYSRTGVQTRFLPKAVSLEPVIQQRSQSHATNTPPPNGDNADAERAERETLEHEATGNAAEESVALPAQTTNEARLKHNLDEEPLPSAQKERSTSPLEQLLRMFPDEDDAQNHPRTEIQPLELSGGQDVQHPANTEYHEEEEDPLMQINRALDLPSDEPCGSTRGQQVQPNYDLFDGYSQPHNYHQNIEQAYNTVYPSADDDCGNVFYDDTQSARADQNQLYEEQEYYYNDEESFCPEEHEQTSTWLEDEPRYDHQTILETLHNAQDPVDIAEEFHGHHSRPGLLLEYPPNRNGLNISHDDDVFEDTRFEKARSGGRLNDVNIEAGLEIDATTFWMPHRLH